MMRSRGMCVRMRRRRGGEDRWEEGGRARREGVRSAQTQTGGKLKVAQACHHGVLEVGSRFCPAAAPLSACGQHDDGSA